MFDSGYIILVLLATILFYMWRSAGSLILNFEALLEKDRQHHLGSVRAVARIPHGATWEEFRLVIVEECNANPDRR